MNILKWNRILERRRYPGVAGRAAPAKLLILAALLFSLFGEAQSQDLYISTDVTLTAGTVLHVDGSIIITATGSLTQAGSGTISVTGGFVNEGVFDAGSGLVVFNGSTSGTITDNTTFNDIVVDKSGGGALFVDADVTAENIDVDGGSLYYYNGATNRTLTINGNLNIASGATFGAFASGARTHYLWIYGDITVEGVFSAFTPMSVVNVSFRGSENSTVSGSGATCDFNLLNVNKDDISDVVQITATNFDAPGTGFLTLTGGTLRMSTAISNPFFTSAQWEIPAGTGLWLDDAGAIVTAQNDYATLSGLLRVSSGEMNVGTGANDRFRYADGSRLILEGGHITVAQAFQRWMGGDAIDYSQTSGTFTVGAVSASSINLRGTFGIGRTTSSFNWTGGVIELQRSNSSTAVGDFNVAASSNTVTDGGTLLINNNGANNSVFQINSSPDVGNLTMLAANNPIVRPLTENLDVLGDITIAGTGSGRLDAATNSRDITLGGDWINNAGSADAFSPGGQSVTLNGSSTQSIGGTQTTSFNDLIINNSADVALGNDIDVDGNLRLVSNSILDLSSSNLTIGSSGEIYSDMGTTQSFTNSKFISNSTTTATGGWLIREIADGSPPPVGLVLYFPVGTPGTSGDVCTPARANFLNGGATFLNADIRVRPVNLEHYAVEKSNASLFKYWQIETNGISVNQQGVNLRFWYDQSEVRGVEGDYYVLQYESGAWIVEPGDNSVNTTNNIMYSDYTPTDPPPPDIEGDWTAGEETVVRAIYYSIANGAFSDPTSWSKVSYGSPIVSSTAPNKSSDRVFIGDGVSITLTANTPAVGEITVEETAGGKGALYTDTYQVQSVDFTLDDSGVLGIGDANGITASANSGNIRSTNRSFSDNGVYIYDGVNVNQVTGDGLPLTIKTLIVNKTGGNQTLTPTNNISIRDSLVILQGILDDDGKTLDGDTPGRTFIMEGGRINLSTDFPDNYSPPTFRAGMVNFEGNSSVYIPSSGSTPGVNQYNDLRIAGSKAYGDVTFEPSGEIRIQGDFTMPVQFNNFNMGSSRLRASGTHFIFNQDGGSQNIPRNCGSSHNPAENYRITYHKLEVAGSGTKVLSDAVDYIIDDEIILTSSTLSVNGNDIELHGDWTNDGGDFNPGTGAETVLFNEDGSANVNDIVSRGVPFNNVEFSGAGTFQHSDASGSFFIVNGDWTNNGNFDPQTGTVQFAGSANQTIDTDPQETFYNLSINNSASTVDLAADNRSIIIENDLDFVQGVLDVNGTGQYVQVEGENTRSGSGHADGRLRLSVPTGDTGDITYHLGSGSDYTPARFDFDGSGGTAGYLEAYALNSSVDATNFDEIARRWEVSKPSTSSFALGGRTYSTTFSYVAGDVGARDPLNFETRKRHGAAAWFTPETGDRGSTWTASLDNDAFASGTDVTYFVVGEPDYLTFYSIADGDWSDASSWSTAGYGGAPATSSPGAGDIVRIGDGKTITLDANVTINNQLIVETDGSSTIGGRLDTETYTVSGSGDFELRDGGRLGVGSAQGVDDAGATGSIQTGGVDFNYGGHNNGHFIFTDAAAITGDGMPAIIGSLEISASVATDLSENVEVSGSVTISSGSELDGNGFDLTLGGDWVKDGDFTPGAGTVEFNGSGEQLIKGASATTFSNLEINKSSGYSVLENNNLYITTLLTFTDGVIDGRTNSLTTYIQNGASVARTSGHVDGAMAKYISTGAATTVYQIGAGDDYTPATVDMTAGGTAGFLAAQEISGAHPNVSDASFDLDDARYVQRYWRLTRPAGSSFDLGARTYDLTLQFLNPDDIRGGADPTNFEMRYYGGSSPWTDPASGYNNAATTIEGTGISSFDNSSNNDFVIGEQGALVQYYSAGSGDWTDNIWSTVGYGGPLAGAGVYPSATTTNDVVYIGNSRTVTLDQDRTFSGVTVEASGGQGHLILDDNVIYGSQFVLANGGKISIGHAQGIANYPDAQGNIQTTIRNYNKNNHNNGYFEYTGSAVVTGAGLPSTVAELNLNTSAAIDLTNAVSVTQDLIINSTFDSNGNDIDISGDWTNNGTFVYNTEDVTFNGSTDQTIGGSASTTFYDFTLDKSGGTIQQAANFNVENLFTWSTDVVVAMNDYSIGIGEDGDFAGAPYDENRMIQFDGTAPSGTISKYFTDGGGNRDVGFIFPIGVGTVYNEAEIRMNATQYTDAHIDVQLFEGIHPAHALASTDLLNKYWRVQYYGIRTIHDNPNTWYKFTFQPEDINGDVNTYIPAKYDWESGWNVNLGDDTREVTTSDPYYIYVRQEDGLNGDWTAGIAAGILSSGTYYSISNGDWDDRDSWSNESHSGPPVVYLPGTFEHDYVIIADGDDITFNPYDDNDVTIGTLIIGGNGNGDLDFERGSNKKLRILDSLIIESDGDVNQTGGGNRIDTLFVYGDVENNSTRNVDLYGGNASYATTLVFAGDDDAEIRGEGNWDLYCVDINKSGGLSSTVTNLSAQFSSELTPRNNSEFKLLSGVYKHDNTGNARINRTGDFEMGDNSGLHVVQGVVRSVDNNFITANNTIVQIEGGEMYFGEGNNDDENFLYNTGTTFTQSGGEVYVRSSFCRAETNSYLHFEMSGGELHAVIYRNRVGFIGFDIGNPPSTFIQSGGTIIIRDISYSQDYMVNASNRRVTGGTLQIGYPGDNFWTGGTGGIGIGNEFPTIWNLHVSDTRNGGNQQACLIKSRPLYVINDVTIDSDGALDLNTNDISIGGDLINNGIIDTDAAGWNGPGGTKQVIFAGSSTYGKLNQSMTITNALQSPIDNGSGYRNEAFYNVIIDKPDGGSVTLANTANSDMIVRNELRFAAGNEGYIDARTNGRMVYLDRQIAGDDPNVQRSGEGHVDGRLRREIEAGPQTIFYPIGVSSTYTPATMVFTGSGGTDWDPLDMITYNSLPGNIGGADLDVNTAVLRYWSVEDPGSFNLGSRTYDLTTEYIYPGDLRNGASWGNFKHFQTRPAPDLVPTLGTVAQGSVQSTGNTALDEDYVVGDNSAIHFYTRADGAWSAVTTWSTTTYGGPTIGSPPFFPQTSNHVAHVGNSNTVVMDFNYTTKSTSVEDAGTGPGGLDCDVYYLSADNFTLEDGTYFATKHREGIRALGSNQGAIRSTLTRNFGEAHYHYNNQIEDQKCGSGLTGTIRSLTIDNNNFTTTLNNPVTIVEDLTINKCVFDAGNNNIVLRRHFTMSNNSEFIPGTGSFQLNGGNDQILSLSDPRGVDFYQFVVNKSSGSITVAGASGGGDVYVENRLQFSSGNASYIDVRTNDRKVVLESTGTALLRSGGSPYGHVDGILQKQINPAAGPYTYEIGYSSTYLPINFIFYGSGGTTGAIDGKIESPVPNNPPPDPLNGPFFGNRMDRSQHVPYYWILDQTVGSFDMGLREINATFRMRRQDYDAIDPSLTVIRRRTLPTAPLEWAEYGYTDLSWNVQPTYASVTLNNPLRWSKFGEFYVGVKAKRTFYSITGPSGGDWNSGLSWAYDEAGTQPCPPQDFPNYDYADGSLEFEQNDEVYIDDNDLIRLNIQPEVMNLNISESSTFVVNESQYVSESPLRTSTFSVLGDATIDNKDDEGFEDETAGIVRFQDRTYDATTNYIFSGAVDQELGSLFPTTINNLTLNMDNNTLATDININNLTVNGDITLYQGALMYDNGDVRTVDLSGDLNIAGGEFTVSTSGAARTHQFNHHGTVVTNDGTWDFRPDCNYKVNTTFDNSGTVTIDGAPSVTARLYTVDLENGVTVDNKTDIDISACADDAVAYTDGTWRQSAGTLYFDDGAGTQYDQTVGTNGALEIVGSGSLEVGNNTTTGANLVLDGGDFLLNTTGSADIGSAAGNGLLYENTGNNITILSGDLNVAGGISRGSDAAAEVNYVQSGGDVSVGVIGQNSATRGSFEIGSANSQISVSGGTITLVNDNTSTAGTRPADFYIASSVGNIDFSGGEILFGDGSTPGGTIFDFAIPNSSASSPESSFWDLTVGQNAELRHSENSTTDNLRLQGDLTVNGTLDILQTRPFSGSGAGSNVANSNLVWQGPNSATQTFTEGASGSTNIRNMTLNRQDAGGGVVWLASDLTLASDGVLDLLEDPGNTYKQVIALGSGVDLTLDNPAGEDPGSPTTGGAIVDALYGAYPISSTMTRGIQTSPESGDLRRKIENDADTRYIFPIGDANSYMPAEFDKSSVSSDGYLAIRVSGGTGPGGAHAQLPGSVGHYLEPFWTVNLEGGLDGRGQLEFNYDDSRIVGTETEAKTIMRWDDPYEQPAGYWEFYALGGEPGGEDGSVIDFANDFFTTKDIGSGGDDLSNLVGDWLFGKYYRIFFSRQSGNWNDDNTWTADPSHAGPIFGPNVYPNRSRDSVVVGGGLNMSGNHVVTLNESATIGGITVGSGPVLGDYKTGTLDCGEFVLAGNKFNLNAQSTLQIGSPDGISALPDLTGNIQFTTGRTFSTGAIYVYSGTTSQSVGGGLPATMRVFNIENTGASGDNTVTLDKDVAVTHSANVIDGRLDIGSQAFTQAAYTGTFTIAADAMVSLNGTNDFRDAANNFAAFTIDVDSYVEFYSSNPDSQIISDTPDNLDASTIGFGNVMINDTGVKFVENPLLVRGNLFVDNNATLFNRSGFDALIVGGFIYNNARINNNGIIQLGQ